MAGKRIVSLIPVIGEWAVQSYGFNRVRPVGRPEVAARHLCEWGADEIALVDIRASLEGRTVSEELIKRVASEIDIPLAAGGGIHDVQAAHDIVASGADKILVGSALFTGQAFISRAVDLLGGQALVVSLDYRVQPGKGPTLFHTSGSEQATFSPVDVFGLIKDLGIGEVVLHAIDRDGSLDGYDFSLLDLIRPDVSMPILMAGGAGSWSDVRQVLDDEAVSAAVVGNRFVHSEHSISRLKSRLIQDGKEVRRNPVTRVYESTAHPDDDRRSIVMSHDLFGN